MGELPVLRWMVWHGEPGEWDAMLSQFPDGSVYQSHGWGEHKIDFGWEAIRIIGMQEDQAMSMAQVLVRRFPAGVAFAWVPGGPIGALESWGENFRSCIKQAAGVRHLYCRVNVLRERVDTDARTIESRGWALPCHPMLSGQSVLLDMQLDEGDWLKSISGKHRYYVKKSSSENLTWVHGNSEDLRKDLAGLTQSLGEEKGIPSLAKDVDGLRSLGRALPGGALILIGYLGSEPVTGCLVLIRRQKAYYSSAATVGRGRQLSAAYCMISQLRRILRDQKVVEFDFGGIDPGTVRSRGVDHFKRGFGGRDIEYLGEWDWATSQILRRAADWIIHRRARVQ